MDYRAAGMAAHEKAQYIPRLVRLSIREVGLLAALSRGDQGSGIEWPTYDITKPAGCLPTGYVMVQLTLIDP
jgi:hypothetical protein